MDGTNLFLATVNKTTNGCNNETSIGPLFCPCNNRGRDCMLCSSATRPTPALSIAPFCECPCECPLRNECVVDGSAGSSEDDDDLEWCDVEVAEQDGDSAVVDVAVLDQFYGERRHGYFASLPQCFETVCSEKPTQRACLVSYNHYVVLRMLFSCYICQDMS